MFKSRPSRTTIELLEARIAPALAVLNPLADLTVGPGKTGADIDLSRMFDPIITDSGHTIVTLHTNFDSDPNTPGVQGDIVIEMLDDQAPLSVQNFLAYLTSTDPKTNYENTFFHRSVSGFIVQGGGFDSSDPANHIPTKFDVHNEFDGVNRSNLVGTIAMAKTGLGPNTGTSEWFVNLANNSSNLDNQNGGFTVFAKVIQGMDVVNAIAALKTFDFGGSTGSVGNVNSAFTNLPLQNYTTDPDNNPNTPAPTPTADNYVRVASYDIQDPPSGNVSGVTYSVNPAVDIVDATTGITSDLVSATVAGSTLHLGYKAHAAGSVRVTVHGADASSTAADTFVVNLQPNLVANFKQDPFDGIIIGGDSKTSNIVIGNNGGGWAVGNVDVKVWLSKVEGSGGTDTNGVLVEPGKDLLIGSFLSQPVDLAGGDTTTLVKDLNIPRLLVTTSGANYRVLVEVTPSDAVIKERFSDDNVSFDSKVHDWENRFGTFTISGFGKRTDAKLVYQEADGDVVQFSMTKEGSGLLTTDGAHTDLAVLSPRPASVLSATIISGAAVGGHTIDLRNMEVLQYVQKIDMPQANLTGVLGATEGFRELTMGDLTGPGLITIGRLPAHVTINPSMTFKSVSDFDVESLSRIRLIRAEKWIDTDGIANHIDALSVGNIAIRGNLEANVTMAGASPVGVFYVAGFFKNATLTTGGDVATVNVGGMDHANFFVGTKARPLNAAGFTQIHSIANLIVRGVPGAAHSFIASNVAAAHIGSISITGVDSINSPTKFGIVADAIRSYIRVGGPTSGPLSEPQRFDGRGRYSLTIV